MSLFWAVVVASSFGALREATVEISFSVSPLVATPGSPPRLVVEVKNVSKEPIAWMRFDSDACFAHFYLQVKVTGAAGEKEAAPPCAVKAWPGKPGELAPGKTERRELNLGALFPGLRWPQGSYLAEASWAPEPLEEYQAGKYAARAAGSSMVRGEFSLAPLVGSFRIVRGQTVTLPGGARFRFDGHGHKDVAAGGPSSPLIISGAFAAPGAKELEEFSSNIRVEEDRFFAVESYAFELGKYEYGRLMQLRCFGPLK